MRVGKPYWAVNIQNEALRDSMPLPEYRTLRKEKWAAAAKILGNRFEFATEKQAAAAKKKLPTGLQEWSSIVERVPVSLGLGWI